MAAASHPAFKTGLGKGRLSLPRSRGGSAEGLEEVLRLSLVQKQERQQHPFDRSRKRQPHPFGSARGPPCASAAASAAPPGLWLLGGAVDGFFLAGEKN